MNKIKTWFHMKTWDLMFWLIIIHFIHTNVRCCNLKVKGRNKLLHSLPLAVLAGSPTSACCVGNLLVVCFHTSNYL